MTVENRWMIQLRSEIKLKNSNSGLQFLFNGALSKFFKDNTSNTYGLKTAEVFF